jgi:hypothetical protein
MAFREVTVIEVKEVLRQWLAGAGKKRIAARVGLDPKTVRRYVRAAEACGLALAGGAATLSDEALAAVIAELGGASPREHGDAWRACVEQRPFLEQKLNNGVRLSKVRRLLLRQGIAVPYSTLHRFAAVELGFGRRVVTLPVVDGKPGEELQVDTGWMTLLEPDGSSRRRRFRAWIFTPSVSRYRFVWPCFHETTEEAIAACEAAWEFYGGVFRVLVPDNTKAIVTRADPLEPLFSQTFLEYAQARGFVIDPTRVRKAKDKARVERSVRDVRDDCFGGERLRDIDDARRRALVWCVEEYGTRSHTSTARLPVSTSRPRRNRASFLLLPSPTTCRSGPSRKSPATTLLRSQRHFTRCRLASSASDFGRAPTRSSCVSTTARRSSRPTPANVAAASPSTRATSRRTAVRTRCATCAAQETSARAWRRRRSLR